MPKQLVRRGKVRELYHHSADLLVMIASDRISAYDTIMRQTVPDKGILLTELSEFWFNQTRTIVPNHLVAGPTTFNQDAARDLNLPQADLRRSMLVKRAERIPMECIVRGYISGSGWRDYNQSQALNGVHLPPGLVVDQQLPDPLFTPSSKAESGHDVPLSRTEGENLVGKQTYATLERLSVQIYEYAHRYALKRGLILADTKFEFGFLGDGRIILIDELLTPDSSRWWRSDSWSAGKPTPPLDKQFLRNWLTYNWNMRDDPPDLPREVVMATRSRYIETYQRLTERKFK